MTSKQVLQILFIECWYSAVDHAFVCFVPNVAYIMMFHMLIRGLLPAWSVAFKSLTSPFKLKDNNDHVLPQNLFTCGQW